MISSFRDGPRLRGGAIGIWVNGAMVTAMAVWLTAVMPLTSVVAQDAAATDPAAAVSRGDSNMPSASAPLKLATWNIRWFPRGCPDRAKCPDMATDVSTLARRITDLDIDLLAVQEILYAADGQAAMAILLAQLDSLGGGNWKVDLQECGAPESQRVGFIWNDSRVRLTNFADMGQLNGALEEGGGACAANLRPGRYAYAQATDGSVDFHAITVHFDSGRRDRDYNNRRDATREIPALRLGDTPITELDEDVVIFGDFNTMGQSEPTEITAEEEFEILDDQIGPSFRRVAPEPFCTQYYRGRGDVLDFFVVSSAIAVTNRAARVAGYCAEAACQDLDEDNMPEDYTRVSDHCPVLLEVAASNP